MSAPATEAKASFALRGHNPDVLTCIANLSNDEVFTPPELANQMLDTVADAWASDHDGASIWANPTVTFLDPFTKSGVFLREITRRLTDGLAQWQPDLWKRVDHILTKQVYGIGITQLTALLARRSVYCSKWADGEHSIAMSFDRDWGNVWFERTEHTWAGDKCAYCGASKSEYDRADGLETHAYAFIHTTDIKARLAQMFGADVQFDVIIGNPPYQLGDGGASASARPIYHSFVEQGMAIEPRHLVMVTPSRWFTGGKGLDEYRSKMLTNRHILCITDYIVASDAFPGTNINGGVSFFHWSREGVGQCLVTTAGPGGVLGDSALRKLDEFDVLVRRNEAVSILRKVRARNEPTFDRGVSARKPFGLPTTFHGAPAPSSTATIRLHGSGRISWVARSALSTKSEWIDRWKVLVARASDGNEIYPLPIWDKRGPFVSAPGEACTETYLVAAVTEDRAAAERVVSYMRSRFFRFLVSLRKNTQDNKADLFRFVPDIASGQTWSDEALFRRYELNLDEIGFVESQIRDMKFDDA